MIQQEETKTLEEVAKELSGGHSATCRYGIGEGDESDYCTCKLQERRNKILQALKSIKTEKA